VIDGVGYIPFEPEAGQIRTRLRDRDQQQAFGRWGEAFGDDTVAAAMTDCLVHHVEVRQAVCRGRYVPDRLA
jgi:hypothetical protein